MTEIHKKYRLASMEEPKRGEVRNHYERKETDSLHRRWSKWFRKDDNNSPATQQRVGGR